mmetsp:Transcript_4747/g.15039  ORF Transcript_4747/g.15039 Transcript_4747/m.15039 type:complete len:210 (-) Transcript_4747:256-885(-)
MTPALAQTRPSSRATRQPAVTAALPAATTRPRSRCTWSTPASPRAPRAPCEARTTWATSPSPWCASTSASPLSISARSSCPARTARARTLSSCGSAICRPQTRSFPATSPSRRRPTSSRSPLWRSPATTRPSPQPNLSSWSRTSCPTCPCPGGPRGRTSAGRRPSSRAAARWPRSPSSLFRPSTLTSSARWTSTASVSSTSAGRSTART